MKTGVTVTNTVQISMDEYKDVKTTKVFDDDATIKDIKTWIIEATKSKSKIEDIGLSFVEISNVF